MVLLAQDAISHQSNSARSKMTVPGGHGCSKLYVGNLSMEIGENDLREFFVDLGVASSSISKMVVKKGFAFVEFVNQAAADLACDLCNGKPLMNTLVRIEPAIRSDQMNQKPRKLVQLLFTNCCLTMTMEDVRKLVLESQISVVTIEAIRSAIPGSSAFVVRVANMKQAQQIVAEWTNKIVGGSRIQIKIMEESFTDGAGGDTFQQQPSFQPSQYIPRNAVYPGSVPVNPVAEGQYPPVENEGTFQLPVRILIPNEFIGAIIGRGGSTIRAISKGTGARVDIFRHSSRSYEMPEKPISIIGPPEKATQACKKVMEIMAQEAIHQRGREHNADIALKISIPSSVVGRIIGKAGAVIKQMMEVTQTKIHIANQPDILEQNMGILRSNRVVTVRGSIEGMSQAESIISEKVREAYADGKVRDRDLEFANVYSQPPLDNQNPVAAYNPYYSPNQSYGQGGTAVAVNRYPLPMQRSHFPLSLNSSNDGISLSRPETAYMYVPDDSVGALIGRNGSSIREIIHSSGASIKVLEGAVLINDFAFRRVVIHGGVDSLFLAEFLIYHRVVDDKIAPNQMEDPQLTIEMTVPTDVVGRLIGKGGANIREIQRQNYCHVKFLTEPDLNIPPPAEGETYVRITGTAHGFLNAQKRIRTLLVKAMNKAFSMSNNEGNNGSRNESPEEECPIGTHETS